MEFSSELPVFLFPKMKWTSNMPISPSIHIQLTAMGMNEMTASSKLPNDSHRKKKTIHPPLSLNLPQRLFGNLGVRCSKFCKKTGIKHDVPLVGDKHVLFTGYDVFESCHHEF